MSSLNRRSVFVSEPSGFRVYILQSGTLISHSQAPLPFILDGFSLQGCITEPSSEWVVMSSKKEEASPEN